MYSLGMEQIALTNGGEKAQVQSVLLLTDGHANHWITSKDGIVAEMKKMQDLGLGAVSAEPSSGRHHHHAPSHALGARTASTTTTKNAAAENGQEEETSAPGFPASPEATGPYATTPTYAATAQFDTASRCATSPTPTCATNAAASSYANAASSYANAAAGPYATTATTYASTAGGCPYEGNRSGYQWIHSKYWSII